MAVPLSQMVTVAQYVLTQRLTGLQRHTLLHGDRSLNGHPPVDRSNRTPFPSSVEAFENVVRIGPGGVASSGDPSSSYPSRTDLPYSHQ